jgi:DNA-binding transcriptional MocR family regulator
MAPLTCRPDELSNLLGRWSTGSGTLIEDLVDALIGLIDAGMVPAGIGMPPQRGLAIALGVSRGVVTTTYSALEARGYLVSIQGSGSRVSSARGHVHARAGGRLFSFTSAPSDLIDLSTGALPASQVATEVISTGLANLSQPYLLTDGYFPGGLPILRKAIADQLTADGIPTKSAEILVTAGAQQATWLTVASLVDSGDLILVEEPTYRGALEVMRSQGARVQGIEPAHGGIDTDQVAAAMRRHPTLLYCQPGIHNPTGQRATGKTRRDLAAIVNHSGVVTVEDRCSADLTLTGPPVAPGMAGLVEPQLLITLGSLSKLFWGGLRIGWIRATPERIKSLSEVLKSIHLGCSVNDQLMAVEMLRRTDDARLERRAMLTESLRLTESELTSALPSWSWEPIKGGSGLWVDTHTDAVGLSERAKRAGLKLVAGPSFSAHGGQRGMLRLPVWHEPQLLRRALAILASLGAKAN